MVQFMKRLFNKNVFKHRITLFTVLIFIKIKTLRKAPYPLCSVGLPYSRKQKPVLFSFKRDPNGNQKGDPKGDLTKRFDISIWRASY